MPDKPWLSIGGHYLLYDFVHLLKSIRNNWLTEKTRELVYFFDGIPKNARWGHLVELWKVESNSPVKLSVNRSCSFSKPGGAAESNNVLESVLG